ncbi:MAG: 16S rRNA (guanine527-N7)-methyltransferase [Planctomycetota bacterium]
MCGGMPLWIAGLDILWRRQRRPESTQHPIVTNAIELRDLAASIGCDIPEERAAWLLAYLDAMLEENKSINLTAVRDREAAVMFHALDSLAMGNAALGLDEDIETCLDLGTGNGFPGVAIACLYPEAKVLLMDRTLKKLKAIERALAVAGFDPEMIGTTQMDAAEGPSKGHKKCFDLITARAVGPPRKIGALALPMLPKGGRLLLWLSDDPSLASLQLKALPRRGKLDYALPKPAARQRRLICFGR